MATFFIGISITAVWAFVYYPSAVIPSQVLVVSDDSFDKTIEYAETDQLGKPEINKNGIYIEYKWSLAGIKSLAGAFYVKNNTGETIKYPANDFDQNSPYWIKQYGKVKKLRPSYLEQGNDVDKVKERELKPNESTVFNIEVPQNDDPFEAGFSFQIGSEQKESIVWVKVKKQLSSEVPVSLKDY